MMASEMVMITVNLSEFVLSNLYNRLCSSDLTLKKKNKQYMFLNAIEYDCKM